MGATDRGDSFNFSTNSASRRVNVFPIILNIAILTNAVGFAGTWLVTIFMTLAATYLVFWDYDRLKPILFDKRAGKTTFLKYELVWLPSLFAFGGIFAALFAWLIRLGNSPNYLGLIQSWESPTNLHLLW